MDDSRCNAALLVIGLLGIGLLQQVPVVSGHARLAITKSLISIDGSSSNANLN